MLKKSFYILFFMTFELLPCHNTHEKAVQESVSSLNPIEFFRQNLSLKFKIKQNVSSKRTIND